MPTFPDRLSSGLLAAPGSSATALDRPLTTPLLVRGFVETRFLVAMLFMAGILAVLATVALTQARPEPVMAGVCLALATLLAVPALVLGGIKFFFRQWLEVTATGFILTGHREKLTFSDDQVVGLASSTRTSSS